MPQQAFLLTDVPPPIDKVTNHQAARLFLSSNAVVADLGSQCHYHRFSDCFATFPMIWSIMSAEGADCFFCRQLRLAGSASSFIPRPHSMAGNSLDHLLLLLLRNQHRKYFREKHCSLQLGTTKESYEVLSRLEMALMYASWGRHRLLSQNAKQAMLNPCPHVDCRKV